MSGYLEVLLSLVCRLPSAGPQRIPPEPRTVTTAAGAVEVKSPRVNDKRVDAETGERMRFCSAVLPWCRKSPKISDVPRLLYLHGLSSGDFVPALEQFLGSAAGLSPATVTRLTQQWQADHAAFMDRDLSGVDYVYVWADGIHLNVRLEEAKACVLVLVGVRADGSKELVALKDGHRESAEPWADPTRTSCWPFSTSPPSTGSICGPRTQSSTHSPP
jgi:putative transposase